jgi:hypothetical protein
MAGFGIVLGLLGVGAALVFGSVKQSGAQAHPTERGYSQSKTKANTSCYGSIPERGL